MAAKGCIIAHISIHSITKVYDKSTLTEYDLRLGDIDELGTTVLHSGVIQSPTLGLTHTVFDDIVIDLIKHSGILLCGIGPKTTSWTDQIVYICDSKPHLHARYVGVSRTLLPSLNVTKIKYELKT